MSIKLVAHNRTYNDGSGRCHVELTYRDLVILRDRLQAGVTGWIKPNEYNLIASIDEVLNAWMEDERTQYPSFPIIR
ncbi:hypothetical protein [Escherichia phage vB_EcoP-R1]|uniref:Uncharacterized protein n=1 Tax=Escherichia phage vB_EcoP-R1 TaxID=3038273 RepID=A0AA47KVI5_9CAUD|nr:hypothetical protein [Escherichia phage vB_EcoP-R1]